MGMKYFKGGAVSGAGKTVRPRLGLMGDSIMALTTNYGAGRPAASALNWALARLGQPWYLPNANNFAVAGTTCDLMIANQLPNVLAAHALNPMSRVFISAGTNDTNGGRSLATIKNDLAAIFGALLDKGIVPVHHGILPRGADGAVTNAKLANMHLNEWMESYAYTRGGLEFIDCGLAIADNSTAAGNALAAMMDGTQLHPQDAAGFWMGKVLADYYAAKGVAPAIRYARSQADKYAATFNPTGVIFDSPNPLMQGGATAPTHMTTSGGAWTMTTQQLPNGQAKPLANCALASGSTHFLYDDALGSGRWDTENIQEGDYLYAACEIELVNVTSLTSCTLQLIESDGGTSAQAECLSQGASPIGNVNAASLTLHLMTPPIQVRPYSGSGNVTAYVKERIVTGAGETGSVRIKSFEMRKWVGEV